MEDKKPSLSDRLVTFFEGFQAFLIVFVIVAAVLAVLWVVVACVAIGLYKLFTIFWKWATGTKRRTLKEPPVTATPEKKQSGETPGKTRQETPKIGKRGWFGVVLLLIGIVWLIVALVRTDWDNGFLHALAIMFWGGVFFTWGERKYGRKSIVTPQPSKKSEGTN